MTIDRLTLLYEGLAWHKGAWQANVCYKRFNELYQKKYAPITDYKRKDEVFERYIIMWANRSKGPWLK